MNNKESNNNEMETDKSDNVLIKDSWPRFCWRGHEMKFIRTRHKDNDNVYKFPLLILLIESLEQFEEGVENEKNSAAKVQEK